MSMFVTWNGRRILYMFSIAALRLRLDALSCCVFSWRPLYLSDVGDTHSLGEKDCGQSVVVVDA
jgi:hypothetical protein